MINPGEVAKYLRDLADTGGVENDSDKMILKAAANIVLVAVGGALGLSEDDLKGGSDE